MIHADLGSTLVVWLVGFGIVAVVLVALANIGVGDDE